MDRNCPICCPSRKNLFAPPYGAGHPKTIRQRKPAIISLRRRSERNHPIETMGYMFPNTISIAGTCNMNQELALMSHLDIMLSMNFRKHAPSFFSGYTSNLYMGCNPSFCRIYGLEPAYRQCCTERFTLPPLLYIRGTSPATERRCSSKRNFARANYKENRKMVISGLSQCTLCLNLYLQYLSNSPHEATCNG